VHRQDGSTKKGLGTTGVLRETARPNEKSNRNRLVRGERDCSADGSIRKRGCHDDLEKGKGFSEFLGKRLWNGVVRFQHYGLDRLTIKIRKLKTADAVYLHFSFFTCEDELETTQLESPHSVLWGILPPPG